MLSPETRETNRRPGRLSRPWRAPARFLRAFVEAVGDSITITSGYPLPEAGEELPLALEHAQKRGGKVLLAETKSLAGPGILRRTAGLLYRIAWIATVLALLALTSVLALAVVPRAFGYSVLVVNGGSMADAMPNGSLVIARWLPGEDVSVGDVILVREDSVTGGAAPKIHRIVSKQIDGPRILVRTKGDANDAPDPREFILPRRVVTPALTVPYAGRVAGLMATPRGWVFFILLPAILAAAAAIHAIWFPARRSQPKVAAEPWLA